MPAQRRARRRRKNSNIIKAKSVTTAFERALSALDRQRYVLRLYVTGMSPLSARAVANAKALCEGHLQGRYELHVIDVYQESSRCRDDMLVALPMLIKVLPLPLRRLVGDLSDTDRVLAALDLKQAP